MSAEAAQPEKHRLPLDTASDDEAGQPAGGVRSLKELLDRVSGRGLAPLREPGASGLVEVQPFPFMGIVGQREMKLALVLSLVNPLIGGVLLLGPRGAGKTTAVRSLADLLPQVQRSLCYYGCLAEDIESGGMEAVCPDCARKFAEGAPLSAPDSVRLVELPLNARLEDVVGGIDERAIAHSRLRLRRGILAQADLNLLYVDEVNLLQSEIVDAMLDAAAQGMYTVRRGPVSAAYRARFVLIGSMNPEEGRLRPQIMDRFGLRVIVRGLGQLDDRLEAYQRVRAYQTAPLRVIEAFREDTQTLREDIQTARALLPKVELGEAAARLGLQMIERLRIDSLRAEITLFETARAYAAADGRSLALPEDVAEVAPMALRLRRSQFMREFFDQQHQEEDEIAVILKEFTAIP